MFQANAPWYQDVSIAPLDAESATVMAGLQARGGWGGGSLRIDFSIEVLRADASTPMRTFTPNDEFYDPDCDNVPVPVPASGRLEGETGYTCTNDGDCHLIVVQGDKLYEMWRANISGGTFTGGCMAVWDLKRDYWSSSTPSSYGRGMQCTSADAAGYPIADLLFTADEVKAGEINHAIRFILPNDRIRKGELVLPGHPLGRRQGHAHRGHRPLRRPPAAEGDVDSARLKPGAQVVARALQEVRHVPRRRRQHRPDRQGRHRQRGQVGRPAEPRRPRRPEGQRLRDGRRRRPHPRHQRLRPDELARPFWTEN